VEPHSESRRGIPVRYANSRLGPFFSPLVGFPAAAAHKNYGAEQHGYHRTDHSDRV
jgi:hypothetical protein